jgi:tetratricopeptide (TPR) repeat protein
MSPTIELSMIVKNEASSLARTLDSVLPFIDRIVIGDTGSTDATLEIARRYGAEIIAVPWEQDFARARNHVLERSRCDWVLVLDADEMLDAEAPTTIPKLIERPDIFAYDVWRWNYVREFHSRSGEQAALPNPVRLEQARPYPAYVRSLNTRLFRRHPGIYFEHCVHEHVSDRIAALGMAKAIATFVIHHFGHVENSEEVRRNKNELYQKLGHKKIESDPDDYQAWFELGLGELEHYKRPSEALLHFNRACELRPRAAAAQLFAGICLVRMGQYSEALKRLAQAELLDAQNPLLHEAIGDASFHSEDYSQAHISYERSRTLGNRSPLTDAKQGAAEVQSGLIPQGLQRIRNAVERNPKLGELYDILVAAALKSNDLVLATQASERRLTLGKLAGSHFVISAGLHFRAGELTKANAILQTGISHFPQDQALQQALKAIAARGLTPQAKSANGRIEHGALNADPEP